MKSKRTYTAGLLVVLTVLYSAAEDDTADKTATTVRQEKVDTVMAADTTPAEASPTDSTVETGRKQRPSGMDDIVQGTRRIVNGSLKIAKSVVDEVRVSHDCDDDEEDCNEHEGAESADTNGPRVEQHFDIAAAVHKSRRQGYGGGLGIAPAIAAVNMRPVYDMIQADHHYLAGRTFPTLEDGYILMMGSGMVGYGGVGNGVRIGGYMWGGDWNVVSTAYGASLDSATVLAIHFGHGGLLIEKNHVFDRLNVAIGGALAFGRYEVKLLETTKNSAFVKLPDGLPNEVKAQAAFSGLEVHGGFTYSFLPWMHLGADVNGLVAGSLKGFEGPGNNPFLVLSPGLRLRIMFGNIG